MGVRYQLGRPSTKGRMVLFYRPALTLSAATIGGSAMSIFSRASIYANLSPAERAFLRFLGLLALGALIAGAQAVMPLLASANPLNLAAVPWAAVAHTFLTAAVIAVGSGISKYHQAQGDPPLPSASAYNTSSSASASSGSSFASTYSAPPASTLAASPSALPASPGPSAPTAGGA